MDVLVSLVIAFGCLIGAFVLDGGHVTKLLEPTAAMIVFGGTFGAVGFSFPMAIIKKVPRLLRIVISNKKFDKEKLIEQIKELSIKVRKEGLLSLESEMQTGDYDSFLKHGLELVTDGIDAEVIKKSLETRIDNMEYRHSKGISVFEAAGGYSPTMGIVGTVMGLVHVLGSLEDVSTIGPKIAVAFIATLYGIGAANLLWLPIANRLKEIDADEILEKSMMIEGIMLICSGSNVSLVEERLRGFLEDAQEKREEGQQ
jgi:chemotaxis protein MotA